MGSNFQGDTMSPSPHNRAVEFHNLAAHAHAAAAAAHEKGDYLSARELSKKAHEYSVMKAHEYSVMAHKHTEDLTAEAAKLRKE
jgi:hypothetical protein